MAAVREICGSLMSLSKLQHASPSQLPFLRTMTSKIFVKGLAFSTTEDKLAEAFSQYGKVLKADIVLNRAKTRSKGFGYVTFAKEEDAQKAQIGMNRKILHGRVLYVDMEPPDKHKKSISEGATDS
ncbi:small RNA-binding protein 11, chloroplastic-like isoform X2 [Lotus japonicus]|nr:small RNA-binding protein 11, chloroplastic-like isoform X2 [Lotus japonicus]XP_057429467.1 small RNA-binding protein 11, chloroplastic-like isoform X2 [Lotus japonicus]XP_057450177.1 small RNA-binding protein 11, chloroplastic-like isoform X2 [Lotus japonicus]XP_057450178.1 small RNA-binding protein 11, chloroplastic-like isoform X2 [Lotus japonicus]XP_057450179.1 small RNA-binding protein 11, chloroplastic-like isoform X2 [Lotus japonicus]